MHHRILGEYVFAPTVGDKSTYLDQDEALRALLRREACPVQTSVNLTPLFVPLFRDFPVLEILISGPDRPSVIFVGWRLPLVFSRRIALDYRFLRLDSLGTSFFTALIEYSVIIFFFYFFLLVWVQRQMKTFNLFRYIITDNGNPFFFRILWAHIFQLSNLDNHPSEKIKFAFDADRNRSS